MVSLRKRLSAQFILTLIAVFFVGTIPTSIYIWQTTSSASEEAMLANLNAQLGMLEASLNTLRKDAEQSLKAALTGLAQMAPAPYTLDSSDKIVVGNRDAPTLRAADSILTGNHKACDQVSAMLGGVCSIFARDGDDFVRVSSTVKKPDGSRSVGTLLSRKSAAYEAALKGEDTLSIASVEGKTFMALYRPIKDGKLRVIGVIAVGYDFTERLAAFKAQLASLKIGETGYFYVIDSTPGDRAGTFVVHPSLEGKNVRGTKDADGQLLFDNILEKRNGVVHYRWINTGEASARDKVAVFRHIASWDWIIAGGSYVEELTRSGKHVVLGLIAGLILQAVVMTCLIAWLFARQIGQPLETAKTVIASIANGDLSQVVTTVREDEIGEMLRSVESMRSGLSSMIDAVRRVATELASRAKSLSETSRHSGISAQEQSSSANFIAQASEQLHANLGIVDKNACEVQEFADKASEQSALGGRVISQATTEMRQIAEQVGQSTKVVQALAKEASNIGDIVKVIQGLAEQTNLLALNAAIEAARAGDTGRGFAVVAGEVRKLAEGTHQATGNISIVVSNIQNYSSQAAKLMETASAQVGEGVRLADKAQVAIETISQGACELTSQLNAITTSLREQNVAGSDIARNIETVARKSEETAQDASRVADEVTRMEALAVELNATVRRFKL